MQSGMGGGPPIAGRVQGPNTAGMDGPFQLRHPDEFVYVTRGGRYYSSGFVIWADCEQTLTLPYHSPGDSPHDPAAGGTGPWLAELLPGRPQHHLPGRTAVSGGSHQRGRPWRQGDRAQRQPGVSGRQPGDAASAPPAAPSARIPPACQPAGPWPRAASCQKPCPWRGRVRW
jgi:hypothetical protein